MMFAKKSIERDGIAVVEAVTVCVCLTLLMSISLPHLTRLKDDEKLRQCKDRMREIAVATHSFHDANKRLPPATIGYQAAVDFKAWSNDPDYESFWKHVQNTSSLALIQPFLELRETYEQIAPIAYDMYTLFPDYWASAGKTFDWQGTIPTNIHDVSRKSIDKFACPADNINDQAISAMIATQPCVPYGDDNEDIAIQTWPGSVDKQPKYTNYVACGGAFGGKAFSNPKERVWRGAMTPRSRMTLEVIADGTSRTFMYGETLGEIDDGKRKHAMSWMWGGFARVRGNLPPHQESHPDNMQVMALGNDQFACGVGFGSKHDNVVVFALCDASVVEIKTSIDLQVLYQLAGAFDGGSPDGF